MNYETRKQLYQKIEEDYDTKVISYVTGTRPGAQLQISDDCINYFVETLDKIGTRQKISLILHTNGGNVDAAWQIVNLIKMYCEEFEAIIPQLAKSGGTLISIGAKSIVMTKQASLSPIDPTFFNHALAPTDKQSNRPAPVSVEAFQGFFEFAEKELKIVNPEILGTLLCRYQSELHPLVIGEISRS